jgi:hypothetical protein
MIVPSAEASTDHKPRSSPAVTQTVQGYGHKPLVTSRDAVPCIATGYKPRFIPRVETSAGTGGGPSGTLSSG